MQRASLSRLGTAAVLSLALPALAGGQIATTAPAETAAERQARVERGLFGEIRVEGATWTVEERMRHHRLAGMSVAVLRDGELDWAAGYGVRDVRTQEPVTTETLFQAASISKPVSALAAMSLVQDGLLPLEDEIRDYLDTWELREDEVSTEYDLTLEQLLSHTGGTTVHGFAGYARYEPVPTLDQVLDGAPPANSDRVVMDIEPGTRFRYSGGGSTIAQRVMIDASGKDFATLLRERVLEPLGMRHSTYEQPLPVERWPNHANAHHDSGARVPGEFHTYPEQFAAGLWTTPSDLGRMFLELQRACAGESERVVSTETAQRMLEPVLGEYGLGFQLRDVDGAVEFGHGGSNMGFKCNAWAQLEGERLGVIVMTNGDSGPRVAQELMQAVWHEYGWAGHSTPELEAVEQDAATLAACLGRYDLGRGKVLLVEASEDERAPLRARLFPDPGIELVPVTQAGFVDPSRGHRYAFEGFAEVSGQYTSVRMQHKGGRARFGERLPENDEPGPVELLCRGQVDAGLSRLRALHAADPDARELSDARLNGLAIELYNAGDLEAAVAVGELNIELHPGSANSWDTLAQALERLERFDDAAGAYSMVLQTLPDDTGLNERARQSLKRQAATWLTERERAQEARAVEAH